MTVQFEEDQPFGQTVALQEEKPRGLIKFLMNEGVAWSPRAAKIELGFLAVLMLAASVALFIYQHKLTNSSVEVKYDPLKDPMTNIVTR